MPSGRKKKYVALIAVVIASAASLLAWSQPWFHLSIAGASETPVQIDVAGSVAAPALAALALAGLALVCALAISGPVFRMIMGFLAYAIGGSVALSAFLAMCNPIATSAPAVSAVTGITGTGSLSAVVESQSTTVWPILALFSAALLVSAGIAVHITGRQWPSGSRRHNTSRYESARWPHETVPALSTEIPPHDPVTAWDDLSRGTDPTR